MWICVGEFSLVLFSPGRAWPNEMPESADLRIEWPGPAAGLRGVLSVSALLAVTCWRAHLRQTKDACLLSIYIATQTLPLLPCPLTGQGGPSPGACMLVSTPSSVEPKTQCSNDSPSYAVLSAQTTVPAMQCSNDSSVDGIAWVNSS
jgi:hypothetical protein